MQDLRAIAQCCPRLTSLNISSCRSLDPAALSILLPSACTSDSSRALPASAGQRSPRLLAPDTQEVVSSQELGLVAGQQGCALPLLTSLDVSYCSLPPEVVCSLLQHGCRFQVGWMHACNKQLVLHDRQCVAVAMDTLCAVQLSTNANCQAVSWQCCKCQSSELSALHMIDSLIIPGVLFSQSFHLPST